MMQGTLEGCYVRYDGTRLVIGNPLIERAYEVAGGMLRPVSLLDKKLGREWLAPGRERFLFRLPGMGEEEARAISVDWGRGDHDGLSAPFLYARLTMEFAACRVETTLRVHPGVPAVSTSHSVQGRPGRTDWTELPIREFRACRQEAHLMKQAPWPRPDTVESIPLAPRHIRARAVRLFDVTDNFNTPVREETALPYGPGFEKLQGNLLFVEDLLERAGLFVVKESPTLLGQLNYPGFDFHIAGRELIEVRGTGLRPEELRPETAFGTYSCTVGVFDPVREDGDEALRAWYEAEDLFVPERDVYILSNTWGNRSLDRRVREEFILREIDRAAELGVDVCQIDYGWQRGELIDPATGAVDKKGRYRGRDPRFWTIRRDRFPEEFAPRAEHAARRGVELGVWFAPDQDGEFADWELDRDVLLDLYRRFGVRHFKLDIFNVESKLGESRLLKMLSDLQLLENRYTDFGNYYPHYSLRNLWLLSKYVPSRRVEIEFLDPDRNPQNYPDDPLAPHHHGIDYCFAVSMFGSPLAWMEMDLLSADEVAALRPVIAAYRRERERIFQCSTYPVGEEPLGTSWTGLQAAHPDGWGYLLVFRELNERPSARLRLRGLAGRRLRLEGVCGSALACDGRVDGAGEMEVGLERPRSFALVRYRAE